jgi:hypothetical protein
MKSYIRESFLRTKIHNLLLEAVIDDLISKSCRKAKEWKFVENSLTSAGIVRNSSSLANYLKWLYKYVSETSEEPLSHVVDLVIEFDKLKNKSAKWVDENRNPLSKDIFSFDRNELALTIDNVLRADVEKNIENELNIKPDAVVKDPKHSNWKIYLPKNQTESVEIANRGAAVSWCTAAIDSQNLYYYYQMRNVFLFYILDANYPKRKFCIGVKDGKIIPGNIDGGATVNTENKKFPFSAHEQEFGAKNMKEIHSKILSIANSYNNVPPGRKIVKKIVKDGRSFRNMFSKWSKSSRMTMIYEFFIYDEERPRMSKGDGVYHDLLTNLSFYVDMPDIDLESEDDYDMDDSEMMAAIGIVDVIIINLFAEANAKSYKTLKLLRKAFDDHDFAIEYFDKFVSESIIASSNYYKRKGKNFDDYFEPIHKNPNTYL